MKNYKLLSGNEALAQGAYEAGLKFADILGKFNTKVIIFITYYLFITPFAIIYRMFNRKQVNDFFDKKEKSYFKNVNKKFEKKDLEQLW